MTYADAKRIFDEALGYDDAASWPEPENLVTRHDVVDQYPIDALPDGIRQAVQEVQRFVQCPVAIVANVAIAAISIIGQSLVDVRRAITLSSPSGLYFLTIAESGERKSSCDNYFIKPIRDWEKQQYLDAQPAIQRYEAAMRVWNAKIKGMQGAIERAARTGKPCEEKERELVELQQQQPQAPRIQRLIYSDTTPEALAFNLASKWPSGGVMSSEAGIVFGGAGMSKDSVMRNLALLNTLWDGAPTNVDRKTSESFVVRGVRLSMGLAVQPDTVRRFFEDTKGMARGTGFAARFLVAWPPSTQGTRLYREAPAHWPTLFAYHIRLNELLEMPTQLDETGAISVVTLDFSPEAKTAWIKFHDDVEVELKAGGDMEETRDVASKAADNAARMAALFHLYAYGTQGTISLTHMEAAAAIVGWHLYEARRFLGVVALSRQASNAVMMDTWLIKHFKEAKAAFISIRDLQRLCPNALRKRPILDAALGELIGVNRIRLRENGKQQVVEVNPALLKETNGAA